MADGLPILKRKRATLRSTITRCATAINDSTEATSLVDLEYNRNRLQETLDQLTSLDDSIHSLLDDTEYVTDVDTCETYIDSAKRAIYKATRAIDTQLSASVSRLSFTSTSLPPPTPTVPTVKLPTIKLEPFSGDIESWTRFWEQFQSSVDTNPSVSQINKHVFLRGYLEGEPKHLVDGIAVTADNYEETKRILHAKYGDINRIIQAHLDYLEDLKPIRSVTPDLLNSTYVECYRRLQALRALGENVNNYGRILAPKILRAFPDDICRRWIIHAKREQLSEGDITKLMAFLNEEVEGAIITQKIRGDATGSNTPTPTTAAFHVHTKSTKPPTRDPKGRREPFCVFCENRGHWAQDCKEVTDVKDRTEKLRLTSRCFLCLNRGHSLKDCSKRGKVLCLKCKKSHHHSICNADRPVSTSVNQINTQSRDFTHLQTARIWLTGPTGLKKLTRCLLDAGSQSSFIHTSLVDQLQLPVLDQRDVIITPFESTSTARHPRRLVQFTLQGIWAKTTFTVTAFESAHTYSAHPTVPHDVSTLRCTRDLRLADPNDTSPDPPIQVLIGGDHYWKLIKDNPPIRISPSLVLLPSALGWVLSGNRSGVSVNHVAVNQIELDRDCDFRDSQIRRFWSLEAMGITDTDTAPNSTKDTTTLCSFSDSFRIGDGRAVVSLPKKEHVIPADNMPNALRRFNSLTKRFDTDPDFKAMYENKMMDYILQHQVEVAPRSPSAAPTFYLPHHAVKKGKRTPVKWRIVFDASSHEPGSPSLNDFLEMGPNLLPEILSVLLRFRLHKYAILGDVSQAFLQITLDPEDRDLTRFLWFRLEPNGHGSYDTTDDVITYRFTRLPFGLTCSPFLLSATIGTLATMHHDTYPTASALMDRSTYMDDFATSALHDEDITTIFFEVTSLLNTIQLPMYKWATNSTHLQGIWQTRGLPLQTVTQVLGVGWDVQSDTLHTDHTDITRTLSDRPATKRQVLQITSRFYDPLGLFSPVAIVGKILFQDTWTRGLTWDETLPQDIAVKWLAWTSELHLLSDVHVPRWMGARTHQLQDCEVHVFGDASERAYGAVAYLRSTVDTSVTVQLICSKARLAPIKRVTLPRLELLAALVATRLLRYFCQGTDYDISKAILWSDSEITLAWIRGDPNRWKTFVCNRVTEIVECTDPSQWRHCPGSENPADFLSRGLNTNDLNSQTWWNGPVWLRDAPDHWPRDIRTDRASIPEKRGTPRQILTVRSHTPFLDVYKFSSYIKLLRVVAWILRFLRNLRGADKTLGELTASELHESRHHLLQLVQQDAFPAEYDALLHDRPLPTSSKIVRFQPFFQHNTIRLGGRLHFADLPHTEKHPILLDGSHHVTHLLIRHTHIQLHHLGVRVVLSHLRHEFWILRARQNIKKVLRNCLPCKMASNARGQVVEAPLPAERVQPSTPFAVTGLDFAGPLYTKKDQSAKSYILLLTCATTRALHLELSSDMSVDRFLMALDRFVSRRGLPHTIYSDNATTFQAARRELAEICTIFRDPRTSHYFAHRGINWKFIAPRAAWWGGWWERMVGTTKRCIRKVLGKRQVDDEQMNTILASIEAAINSRPLTQDDGPEALTPAHFLHGGRLTTIPIGPEPTSTKSLTKEFRLKQQVAEDFWKRWTKEYLLELRTYHQVRQPCGEETRCRVGDVVLLQAEVRPRHMWKRGRVEELRPGRDGKVRTVILRTQEGGRLVRPVQLIIPLEVDQGGEDVEDVKG